MGDEKQIAEEKNIDEKIKNYVDYLESQLNNLHSSYNTLGPTLEEGRGPRITCYRNAKNKFLEIFNANEDWRN